MADESKVKAVHHSGGFFAVKSDMTANSDEVIPTQKAVVTHVADGTVTMANKTLTTPVIASFYMDAAKTKLMSAPDTLSDTLVTLNATQQLVNKTVTSGIINCAAGGRIQVQSSTPVNAVAAKGTMTLTGIPVADETFTIGTQVFTFKAARAVAGEVTIGADAPGTVTNIVTAVTADITNVTAADGAGDTVVFTAVTKGASGNSIVFTESATNIAVNGTGTLGATTLGVDGTVGSLMEMRADASYLYVCIQGNTVADTNWRRITLGSAY